MVIGAAAALPDYLSDFSLNISGGQKVISAEAKGRFSIN
jgi:hypothetical protein